MKISIIGLFMFVCFSFSVLSLNPQKLTQSIVQNLKTQQDYIHHFIFFNTQTFFKINQKFSHILDQLASQRDIKFYINDCQQVIMKQCQTKDHIPLMLLFNRIFIRFNGGNNQNQLQEIIDWIDSRLLSSPVQIHLKQQLQQQLKITPELFCLCKNQKVPQQKALFYSLSKAMILTNYCIIQQFKICTQLGLKQSNATLFKNGTLQHRIQLQYFNRYDIWQNFLKINTINHVPRINEVLQKRFAQENKNIDTTIVLCDFSYKCQQFWIEFQSWSRKFQQNKKEVNLRMNFVDKREATLINIYLHTKVNHTKFPALLNIKLLSQNGKSGWIRRYIKYPQNVNEEEIMKFLKEIKVGEIKEQYLSGQLPKKNGFTGKASQKLIQKVVAQNVNQTIEASQKHYVLLISTLGTQQCKQCDQFYKQYKKVASFLQDEEITFGFMEGMQNQMKMDNVQTIPQILLYSKYFKKDPSRMTGKKDFDGVMRFLQNNALINYSTDL